MQCNEKSFLGHHIVSRTVFFFVWAVLLASVLVFYLKIFQPIPSDKTLILSLNELLIISFLFVAFCITFGLAIANVLSPIILFPINFLISKDTNHILNIQSVHSWPGRQILDEIRSSQHSVLKRKFLSAGLDTTLTLPKHYDQELIGQQFSLFQSIERVLLSKECNDLAETVHEAKNIIFNFFRLTRLKGLLQNSLFFLLPVFSIYFMGEHLSDLLNQVLPNEAIKNYKKYQDIILIKNFITPGALVILAPYVVYLIGNMIFLFSWGFVQKTKSQIDDILLLGGSWLIAGAFGVFVLLNTSTSIDYKYKLDSPEVPQVYSKLTNTFVLLVSPMPYPGDNKKYCTFEKSAQRKDSKNISSNKISDEIKAKNLCKDYEKFNESYISSTQKTPLFFIKAFVVLWLTFIFILILRMSCNRIFRKIASKTIQKHDDMAIEIIRIFGTFLVAALGLGWTMLILLSHYQGSPAVDTGANSLMPYAILVGVAGTILGIGSRDLLDNFFAGISLQIDRPFELGERIILKTGEVCEVRSIGMRSTHFYNISEHADMFVPNTELAKQTVTNLSRPDRQYRRTIKYYISPNINKKSIRKMADNLTALELAEGAVLLAAYSVDGIDIPTILDQELEASSFYKSRNSIVAEYQHVQERFDEFMNAQFKFEGRFQPVSGVVESNALAASQNIQRLNKTKSFRWDYITAHVKNRSNNNIEELVNECKLARQISYNLFKLASCFYTLGATYPTLKSELEPLSLEILRAPTVRSKHIISESGSSLWEIELLVYAQLTEQSGEILHHMNIMINRYLIELGLSPDDIYFSK